MFGPSFRLSLAQVVPRSAALGAACLIAGLGLAGCGGGTTAPVRLTGDGFGFSAPGGWKVTRTGTSVSALHGAGAVSVTTFRLLKPYRPAFRVAVVKELDGVAAQLAAELHGRVIAMRRVQARQYDLAFVRNGDKLVERITFVLRGRREYELLCRFKEGKSAAACALLQSSFRAG